MKKLLIILVVACMAACNQRDANSGPAPENETKEYPQPPDSLSKYTDSTGEKDSGAHDADHEH